MEPPAVVGFMTEHVECEQCGREVPAAVYTEHLLKECPGDGN